MNRSQGPPPPSQSSMDPSAMNSQHGSMGVSQAPGVPMTPQAQAIYNEKLRALKPYCENLK